MTLAWIVGRVNKMVVNACKYPLVEMGVVSSWGCTRRPELQWSLSEYWGCGDESISWWICWGVTSRNVGIYLSQKKNTGTSQVIFSVEHGGGGIMVFFAASAPLIVCHHWYIDTFLYFLNSYDPKRQHKTRKTHSNGKRTLPPHWSIVVVVPW